MDQPLVSVIIATHNRWPLVRDAVDSALAQEGGQAEVIVVDDGSTDSTADLLEAERPAIRVIRQTNTERGAARNHGLALASGRFVVFLDADDMLEPWYLSQFLGRWRAGSDRDHIYACGYQRWFSDTGRMQAVPPPTARGGELLHLALWATVWGPGCAIVPRALALEVDGFPEPRAIASSEDWLFQVRVIASGVPVEVLPRPGVRQREHDGRSLNDDLVVISSRLAALELLLGEEVAGRSLTASERALAIAGTHRVCAAHAYRAGRMAEARSHLREVVRQLGWRAGMKSSGRLWLQTWLGARGSEAARRIRSRAVDATRAPGS